jgi:hypothetical protein
MGEEAFDAALKATLNTSELTQPDQE